MDWTVSRRFLGQAKNGDPHVPVPRRSATDGVLRVDRIFVYAFLIPAASIVASALIAYVIPGITRLLFGDSSAGYEHVFTIALLASPMALAVVLVERMTWRYLKEASQRDECNT